MDRTNPSISKIMSLLILLFFVACRPFPNSQTFSANEDYSEVDVAVVATPPAPAQHLLEVLQARSKIHEHSLTQASEAIPGSSITESIDLLYPEQAASPYQTSQIINRVDKFKGFVFQDKIIAFKAQKEPGLTGNYWIPHSIVPRSILQGKSDLEKMRYFLDAKYYEPLRLEQMSANLDAAELMLGFVPGYAGAEKVFYTAESKWDVMVGSAQILGDAATLGLGSKIQVVRKGAAGVIMLATSVRLSDAAMRAHNGKFSTAIAIDAFLATVEASLAIVSVIKIKIPRGGNAMVKNIDEATALSPHLGKDADNILRHGLDDADLVKLGVKKASDGLQNATTIADDLAEILACLKGASTGFTASLALTGTVTADACKNIAKVSNGATYGIDLAAITNNALPKNIDSRITKKFINALDHMAGSSTGVSGIKTLTKNGSHHSLPVGYTHELKIGNSPARLLGKLEEIVIEGEKKVVVVFGHFVAGGLH